MLKPQPLENLRDIHLPDPINWWPISINLLWIIVLMIIIIIIGVIYLYKQRKYNKIKRQTLRMLRVLEKQSDQAASLSAISVEISKLLRNCAQVYFPQHNISGLQGMAWVNFLNQTATGVDFTVVAPLLIMLPYQKPTQFSATSVQNFKLLINQVKTWVIQRDRHA